MEAPTTSIFYYRPKAGDLWRFKTPSMKRWRKKRIGHISRPYVTRKRGGQKLSLRIPFVNWERLPKGRYSGLTVKALLKYGELVERPDPNSRLALLFKEEHMRLRRSTRW